jgi:hypothetical protein
MVVTDATALPRSASGAPRPAAPNVVGAATEIPAPPRAKPRRASGRAGGSRPAPASGSRQRAAGQELPVAHPGLQPLAKEPARDHGGREEPWAETAHGRGRLELGLEEERAPVLDPALDYEGDPAERP